MKLLNLLFITLFVGTVSHKAFAQEQGKDMEKLVEGTKNDLLVVISGGLAGAVLGLSTLSFVEEPKEHTRNIIVGASLGIIAGVGYVAYSQASKSREMMYGPEGDPVVKLDNKKFDTFARSGWHHSEVSQRSKMISSLEQISYSFKF